MVLASRMLPTVREHALKTIVKAMSKFYAENEVQKHQTRVQHDHIFPRNILVSSTVSRISGECTRVFWYKFNILVIYMGNTNVLFRMHDWFSGDYFLTALVIF